MPIDAMYVVLLYFCIIVAYLLLSWQCGVSSFQ